jgi:hypothetical protein
MNIFASFPCPTKSALYLDDKRVNKMLLENAQMLSAVCDHYGRHDEETMYKVAYKNHPCTLWLCEDLHNVNWLFKHSEALHDIYRKNNFYSKRHSSFPIIVNCILALTKEAAINHVKQTPFVNCTPYKDMEVHEAYRKTLQEKWQNDKHRPTWSGRDNQMEV